jgi:L-ascorbate metabolism protein UlaG (beta-lactamase superfamily)
MSVLTDPMFSPRMFALKRLAPPGLQLEALPPIDVVVISHNHRDHLDEPSVRALGNGPSYVVPLGLGGWFKKRGLHKVIELDWWQETELAGRASRIRVTLVPAQHWSMRSPLDQNRSLWGGFVIESPAVRFYFAGDTGYPAAFKDIGKQFPAIDYALLPIGAYEPRWFMQPQHIGPKEAAIAFGELGAKALVPMHWGTFRLSDEPLAEPPQLLRSALGQQVGKLAELAIGETRWGKP